jgi:hypothetical protein
MYTVLDSTQPLADQLDSTSATCDYVHTAVSAIQLAIMFDPVFAMAAVTLYDMHAMQKSCILMLHT